MGKHKKKSHSIHRKSKKKKTDKKSHKRKGTLVKSIIAVNYFGAFNDL
jgi:hypothetical protein